MQILEFRSTVCTANCNSC